MIVATGLVVATGGCGHGPPAHRVAAAPTCPQLVGELRRVRFPQTPSARRAALRRLARVERDLRDRYRIRDVAPIVELYAAVVRVREEAASAVRDSRATAARKLFATARVLELRADSLSRDLVARC